jgi:hypothetical protein
MQNDPKHIDILQNKPQSKPGSPNESGQLYLDDFLKITDPNTQEIILEKRA